MMMRRKNITLIITLFMAFSAFFPVVTYAADKNQEAKSVRKERNFIREGNKLYDSGKYRDAIRLYEQALQANPTSVVGRFNLGLSQIRIGNVADTTKASQDMLRKGVENMQASAELGARNPRIASFANYNLGNLAFNKQDYASAIQSYKQALRLNPEDNNARRNLRIAQLKKQEQDKNKKDKDKDKQNQDKDKKDQDKKDQNQNQNQNQDQNQDQNKDQQPPKPKEQDMSDQTANQILQAMENKEQQTRQRVMQGQGSNKGQKAYGRSGGRLNW